MSQRYNEALTNSHGKATARRAEPNFAAGPLELNVIFTDVPATVAALHFAQVIARDLGARIRLRVAIAVPYQLPLDRPPISVAFLQDVLRNLVSGLDANPFEPTIHLYFCRDRVRALFQALQPNSLVVIAGRKRWWPTAESRIVHALESKGHRVIFIDSKARGISRRPTLELPSLERTDVTR